MATTQDLATLRLSDQENTEVAAASLGQTLYTLPLAMFLEGELGAGKTTFIRSFLRNLGIGEPIVSPTYALEQRYKTPTDLEILHLDLYRLRPKEAEELVRGSEDFPGIRCIEWSERLSLETRRASPHITLQFVAVSETERALTLTFDDIPLPTREQIEEWRADLRVPPHIVKHCDAVADFAVQSAEWFQEHAQIIRPLAPRRAAELHDLFKFVDFGANVTPNGFGPSTEDIRTWKYWRERYAETKHERACSLFLQEQGYVALGEIVKTHGLTENVPEKMTIEQKLLFYADKRVQETAVVTLQERFEDGARRYSNGVMSPFQKKWLGITRKMETELFGNSPPPAGRN